MCIGKNREIHTLRVTCDSSGVSTVTSITVGKTAKIREEQIMIICVWLSRKCEKQVEKKN